MRGRWRRFRDVLASSLRVGFAEAMAYRSEFVVWFLSTNTPLIMLVLWHAVAAEAPVGRFGEREFTAYFLTTLVVRLLTGAWVVWEINNEVRSGALAMRLLRPVHPFVAYATENLAAWPLRLAMVVPIIAVLFWVLGPSFLSGDPLQWLLFPVAIAGAWLLTFSAMLVIGSLSLFWHSSFGVFEVWMTLYFVFSGYIVPLELFPPHLAAIVDVLPFRYLISFPVETVLGLVPFATSIEYMLRQWAFIALFGTAALMLWRAGVRRYEAFGG